MPVPAPPLASLLLALRRPIEFAYADGFAGIDRVRNLDTVLMQAAGRLAAALAEGGGEAAVLAEAILSWQRGLSRWAVLPRVEREGLVAAGRQLCEAVASGGSGLAAPAAAPAPGPALVLQAPTAPAANAPPRAPRRRAAASPVVSLSEPLLGLPGVGPRTAEKLLARGLRTRGDALFFLPRRWDDLRQVVPVGGLREGVLQSTVVLVERSRIVPVRRRFLEVLFRGEDQAPLLGRWFHFQGGMARRFVPGARFLLTGIPRPARTGLQVIHPELVELSVPPLSVPPLSVPPLSGPEGRNEPDEPPDDAPYVGTIRVRYPEIEGVPARLLARLCRAVCDESAHLVRDGLPREIAARLHLPPLDQSLRALHLTGDELSAAEIELLNQGLAPPQQRLVFDELFFLQLGLCHKRQQARKEAARPCPSQGRSLDRLRAALPFSPTGAQERAIAQITAELALPHPMQRLLHGDVGSGKTLVAYAAAEVAMAAGRQVAFMAPTELLAEQHARTLRPWARATGRRMALLTASSPRTARKAPLSQGSFAEVARHGEEQGEPLDRESVLGLLRSGGLDLVVGTHALIAERVEFADLGLVVIDEQHRFGVAQRAALRHKGQNDGTAPHLLVMTATPIPRTLALTLYGDLDVTRLDEMPPGRLPPETRVLGGPKARERALGLLNKALAAGRQAYWVCPLIEESDVPNLTYLADVTEAHGHLSAALPDRRVGLVHGRLATAERELVMRRFRDGELAVLVATTVIEVGVDIPNASLMVIEGAQRFGLAQLHQLRGRIGRGGGQSLCLLLCGAAGPPSEAREPAQAQTMTAQARLEVMARTSDGFKVAEADLQIRGPGEILGTRQAGLPPLRYADLLRDIELLQVARDEAGALLQRDPLLGLPEHQATRQVLAERWASLTQLLA